MKKLAIAGLCVAAALGASAQMSLVKEAKSFKPGGDFAQFVETITPAFSNPETANVAETWYVAGKAGFDNYDYLLNMYRLGQAVDEGNMGRSLVKGYEFYRKALPLDSLPDDKGKVKPKFAKKILSEIAGHHNDFNIAGAQLYSAKDYPGAYEAWGIYLDLPTQTGLLGKETPAMPHDTIVSTINFNRALAAWQGGELAKALDAFDAAIDLNYDDPQIFIYAASIASQIGDKERQFKYAKAGYERSGSIDDLRMMINYYIDNNNLAAAKELVGQALSTASADKDRAALYMLDGIIAEYSDPELAKGDESLLASYKKAMELDPTLGAAFYNYGRILFNKANVLDEASTLQDAAYAKYKQDTLAPIMLEAAQNIEQGYELDNSLSNALSLLQQIYYFLNDEANLQRVKNL